jgi:hypothetical protein
MAKLLMQNHKHIFMEPLQPCWKELENFINPGEEIHKKDLLSIIAFRVSYYLYNCIKNYVQYTVGRKQDGEIYFY